MTPLGMLPKEAGDVSRPSSTSSGSGHPSPWSPILLHHIAAEEGQVSIETGIQPTINVITGKPMPADGSTADPETLLLAKLSPAEQLCYANLRYFAMVMMYSRRDIGVAISHAQERAAADPTSFIAMGVLAFVALATLPVSAAGAVTAAGTVGTLKSAAKTRNNSFWT